MISEDDFPICVYKGGAEDDAAWLQKAKGQEMVIQGNLKKLGNEKAVKMIPLKTVMNAREI